MHRITLELESYQQISDIIGNAPGYFLVPNFTPHEAIGWAKASISINGFSLANADVRNMSFDLRTDREGLEKVLNHSTQQFDIYCFSKPVPDTLVIGYLPEQGRDNILKQNGMLHVFDVSFEFLTISSFDEGFIRNIKEHSEYSKMITG
jgi:hypothetical protein